MKLTAHFDSREFRCHDGTEVPAELLPNLQELANRLQVLRDAIGEPLIIVSGYRSPAWNAKVGGAEHSLHMRAMAADVSAKTLTPKQLHARLLMLIKDGKIPDGGVERYSGWLHYDIGRARRW